MPASALYEPGASRVGVAQRGKDGGGRGRVDVLVARDDHGASAGQRAEAGRGRDREACPCPWHWPGLAGRAYEQIVVRVRSEDLRRDPELERQHAR